MLAVLFGCARRAEPPPVMPTRAEASAAVVAAPVAAEAPEPRRLVLVTIDGARWQDMLPGEGVFPNLWARVKTHGVAIADAPGCGVVRAAGWSAVSLPGYLEILTGRTTSCMSNECARVAAPTVLDDAEAAGVRPVASIGSWDLLDRAASSRCGPVTVSAGTRTWCGPKPAAGSRLLRLVEEGARAKRFPAPSGAYRPDAFTAAIALEYLDAERPRLLHVGFGDADEFAHRKDKDAYLRALRQVDGFVAELDGRATTVAVTTDHGRAANLRDHGGRWPESRRAFFFAFGAGVREGDAACLDHDVTLADVGATVRALAGLAPDARPGAGKPITEVLETP